MAVMLWQESGTQDCMLTAWLSARWQQWLDRQEAIGVKWANQLGGWQEDEKHARARFNLFYDGEHVYTIDGQSGEVLGFPYNYGYISEWCALV